MTDCRVLLVEDDPGYARFLREILADAGTSYLIEHAETLEAALVALERADRDVILLDLGLPDADGTEALRRVVEASPDTAIVILSSHADVDVALESMREGAQEYLVKGQAEHVLLTRAVRYAIERKRAQDALASARAEAERANTAKDEFLAMLSHELRNPLAPIVTATSALRQRATPETSRELEIIDRQTQRVIHLVDDLLDVSRIARGKLELQRSVVDIADVVRDGVDAVRPLIDGKKHLLSTQLSMRRLLVNGDRLRLTQVVANVLTNATKFTAPGGHIDITVTSRDDRVLLTIRDDGIGMPGSLLTRVFDLFEQGDHGLDRAAGGLGLGLAIVRNIVTMHGGAVSARSAGLGQGSEIEIDLPVLTDTPLPAARPTAAALPRRTKHARRVLIVDDNEDGAEMLALVVQRLGHETRTLHDGASTLLALAEFSPEVALLDIGLPGMDGYELARRIRGELGERVPVLVAITGYGQESDRELARAAGFDAHFVKPVPIERLAELLESLAAQ